MEKRAHAVSAGGERAFKFTVFCFGLPKHSNMEFYLPNQTFFAVETRQSGELCFSPIYKQSYL